MCDPLNKNDLPLSGLRVVTVEEKLPATFCSMILGDLGADVIIVERPKIGNPARKLLNFLEITNRNKRSVTIDLKKRKGKDCFFKLAIRSDIIIECMRPGVMKRLGIDYENIKKLNPSVIYCSVSGYGQDGPNKYWPGHDLSYQGITGMLSLSPCDRDGLPLASSVPVADLSAGMFAAIGILSCIPGRKEKGGSYLDISMTDGLVYWMSVFLGQFFKGKISPPGIGEPGYGVFRTKNGVITLSVAHEDYFWNSLCEELGINELGLLERSERVRREEELKSILSEKIRNKLTAELVKALTEANIPCAPVLDLHELVRNTHFVERGMFVEFEGEAGRREKQVANPIMFSGKRVPVRRPPPRLGEHNKEILEFLGYSEAEIRLLSKDGVI